MSEQLLFGSPTLVGQHEVRTQIQRLITSNKLSHAYLFSGPAGTGKKAAALAMAEVLNGVENLSQWQANLPKSAKSGWRKHPDIHLFFPVTTDVADDPQHPEITGRLNLLAEDPYTIIDFEQLPSLSSKAGVTNKQSFYPIGYFREAIRKASLYRPNEGQKTVIIITRIERMRKESANAFLKLLEEPPEHLCFILTSDAPEQLLPTITSRCQHLRFRPLHSAEIAKALVQKDHLPLEEADILAKLAQGNFGLTRSFDTQRLRHAHAEALDYLRMSYTQDAFKLYGMIQDWQSSLNRENQMALLSVLEILLRDLYMLQIEPKNEAFIQMNEQKEALVKFITNLPKANIEGMLEEIEPARRFIQQNGNFRIQMTVLSMRFAKLMRGKQPSISQEDIHLHQPAFEY